MIDWENEAKDIHNNPRDVWLIARGASMTMDRFLDIMGDGIVSSWSQDEMILAILFYMEYTNETPKM